LREPGNHGKLSALDPWLCVTGFHQFCYFRWPGNPGRSAVDFWVCKSLRRNEVACAVYLLSQILHLPLLEFHGCVTRIHHPV
jgi:hypothetical protein